jgi:prepilin-type N-terminal cleavage/methylation domain-containing protein
VGPVTAPRSSVGRATGFTLAEILAVLIVIGLAAGLVYARFETDPRHTVERESQRLAAALEHAALLAQWKGETLGISASGNAYRIRTVDALNGYVNFEATNERPIAVPDVGGTVKVVGMNLLNFFNTFANCRNGVGGPVTDCRGANTQAEFDRHHPDVIVGSSRGGAVAMNIASGNTPLVLLCPAWKRRGAAKTVKANTTILHSRADDVASFADSEELIRNSGLRESALIEVGTDHRLADPEPLEAMWKACERTRD